MLHLPWIKDVYNKSHRLVLCFVSDIAIFVLKEDVKLQLTHLFYVRPKCDLQNFDFTIGLE